MAPITEQLDRLAGVDKIATPLAARLRAQKAASPLVQSFLESLVGAQNRVGRVPPETRVSVRSQRPDRITRTASLAVAGQNRRKAPVGGLSKERGGALGVGFSGFAQ